jgi:hypothetical protein
MGAGVLPACIYKNKLYFLFGKEHEYCDTPGFSDFGGGTDNKESYLNTAIREGTEELTGFLGSKKDLSKMLKKGTFNIDHQDNPKYGIYRMHIFKLDYDEHLPFYYNNNQRFIQANLHPSIIKKTKIFEKAEIRWVCIDDLSKMKPQFRSYFQKIVDQVIEKKEDIMRFIKHGSKKTNTRKNR